MAGLCGSGTGHGERDNRTDLAVGVYAGWVRLRAVRATALDHLAHAVVCRRRNLGDNQISTIASGAFARLTALQHLYGAGEEGGQM